ncbi:hypothetical protein HanRHA438_Chr06g0286181 [Helianthus annuus]|nr:hypothetical protein HanRHA438_Chr06g0286181 [Helianthus annuus]
MVKTWWIRRWYILYISVSPCYQNFVKRAMRNSVFSRPLDQIQTLNNSQTHYIRLSMTRLHS